MSQANEISYYVAFMGEKKSGKTEAFRSLTRKDYHFNEAYESTIGTVFSSIKVSDPEQKIHLELWDTGQTEHFDKPPYWLQDWLKNTAIYLIFVDLSKDLVTQMDEVSKWKKIALTNAFNSRAVKHPHQFIVVLSKTDEVSESILNDKREHIDSWLSKPESKYLRYAGICAISAKQKQTHNLYELLINTAKKQVTLQILFEDKSFILPKIEYKQFPEEYSELLAEKDTLQEKLITLFEDYSAWGFHWRSHNEEAEKIVTELKSAKDFNSAKWFHLLVTNYREKLKNPNFDANGNFAERLLYAIKLIDESQQPEPPRLGYS